MNPRVHAKNCKIDTDQETGAVLRPEEIGQAFSFGNESAVPNVLERNWWESEEQIEEQRAIAEEALRLDQERRDKGEYEGEGEDVEMDAGEDGDGAVKTEKRNGKGKGGGEKPKVVARTKVSLYHGKDIRERTSRC